MPWGVKVSLRSRPCWMWLRVVRALSYQSPRLLYYFTHWELQFDSINYIEKYKSCNILCLRIWDHLLYKIHWNKKGALKNCTVKPVLNGAWIEWKPVFSGELLQSREPGVRNVIQPPLLNCLIQFWKWKYSLKVKLHGQLTCRELYCTNGNNEDYT
jgi:hypothetical protein